MRHLRLAATLLLLTLMLSCGQNHQEPVEAHMSHALPLWILCTYMGEPVAEVEAIRADLIPASSADYEIGGRMWEYMDRQFIYHKWYGPIVRKGDRCPT